MKRADRVGWWLNYGVAGLVGATGMFIMLPVATILGTGGLWVMPHGDLAMALTGHLAYQAPGWHWPILLAPDLAWPVGRSVLMTDSNPLMCIIAKSSAGWAGHPVNMLAPWIALCWLLQPVGAVYALRSFGQFEQRTVPSEAALAVGVLSLLCPALLARFPHVNLLGHFLLLAGLGLALRMINGEIARGWLYAGVLLTIAVLVHPYLFIFLAILLSAPAIHAILFAPANRWTTVACYAASCCMPVIILDVLSGGLGSRAGGFGFYSMNLLSPFWPQLSGLFGASLPIIDATKGQYEGFNYQGGGVLLLEAAAIWSLIRRPVGGSANLRAMAAISIPLIALTVLALTPKIFAGTWLILPLPLWPWDRLFASIRASGRAFWIVGYALMIGSIALLTARLNRATLAGLLSAAAILQIIDTTPLRATSQAIYAGKGQTQPPFVLPQTARLLRIVPACDPDTGLADLLRMVAVRQGMRVADVRTARAPAGFDCQSALADGVETKLADDELRFFLPDAVSFLRQSALGRDAICTRTELACSAPHYNQIRCRADLHRPACLCRCCQHHRFASARIV